MAEKCPGILCVARVNSSSSLSMSFILITIRASLSFSAEIGRAGLAAEALDSRLRKGWGRAQAEGEGSAPRVRDCDPLLLALVASAGKAG